MTARKPKPPTKAVAPKWTRAWEQVAKSAEDGDVSTLLRRILAAEAHVQILTGGMGDDAHRRMEHVFRAVEMLSASSSNPSDTLAALFGDTDKDK